MPGCQGEEPGEEHREGHTQGPQPVLGLHQLHTEQEVTEGVQAGQQQAQHQQLEEDQLLIGSE